MELNSTWLEVPSKLYSSMRDHNMAMQNNQAVVWEMMSGGEAS